MDSTSSMSSPHSIEGPLAGGPSVRWAGGERQSVHLRSATTSLVIHALPDEALPRLVHWAAPLGANADPAAITAVSIGSIGHSAPDQPRRRPVLPMPVDGWRLRPSLTGSRPDGRDWSPRFVVSSMTTSDDGRAAVIEAADELAHLSISLIYRLSEFGVLTIDQELRTDGSDAYLVAGLNATLPLPGRAVEVFDLTGRWCRERHPQRQPLGMGTWSREVRSGRTGHDAATVISVGTPGFDFAQGEVWSVHLGWSGNSVMWAERSPAGFGQVGAGELLTPGEVTLAPGQSYAAPTVHAVYSPQGLDGVSAAFHDEVRARPGHPSTARPVILNTWEAVYFDHSLERLTALADVAAQVGVERFVLDDGWFGGRRSDQAGLGDWHVSPDVWPDGLAPLIEHVKGLGMDFGLWVEPEMVNPDSDLYRDQPDWILNVPGRLPPTWRWQHVLDLARPEVFDYLLHQLDRLLTEHDIAFLKWDHNRDLIDSGHHGAAGVHAHTLAVYRLFDELRLRHPGVEIETCASGGGRVDLGILARTDRVWASDTIDAHERQSIQRWTGLLLPPELIGAHIGSGAAHTTGRRHTLAFRAATALFGHFGIESDLTSISADELGQVADAVATYKRLRGLLHSGRVVRIDQPEPAVFIHGVVAHDKSEAVFAYVQLDTLVAEVPAMICLRELDPDALYRVTPLSPAGGPSRQEIALPPWLADGGANLRGDVLMAVGVAPPILQPDNALILHCERL